MFKPRLTYLLVTLPLLAIPAATFLAAPAQAAAAAEEAVRILNKAQAANDKCSYLSSPERNELQRYSARAEIAAASQGSVKNAKAASAAGRADGSNVACSPDTQADVRETLDAARQAVAATRHVTADAPQPERKRRRAVEKVETRADEPVRRTGKGLGFYAQVVQAYYLERECKSLPRADADRFWRGIVDLHNATVAGNGKRAVAQVMARARNAAAGSGCSQNVEAQIRSGYDRILSR